MPNLTEFLDRDLGEKRKDLLEKQRQGATHLKKLEKALREGDLEQAQRTLGWLEGALAKQQEALAQLKESLPAYDVTSYLRGQFADDFIEACQKRELKITGEFPVWEVFPFRVRVQPEKRLVEVDERAVRFLRPEVLADYLKAQRDRLDKENFNPTQFLDTLASAYETALALRRAKYKVELQGNLDVSLNDIYKLLTPLAAQRRQYPRTMFAFDLHRLFVANVFVASDGRRLVLGDTRQRSSMLVVYDAQGHEHRYGSLRFVAGGEE